MKLNILRADPAGNITLFVLDPVAPEERANLAARLMSEFPELGAEQVGFICPTEGHGDGCMRMMGGEFCGNATRAFGLLVAQKLGGVSEVLVETSGCDHPVHVTVDVTAGTSRSEMPLPQLVLSETVDNVPSTLVHLGGIAHLVVENVAPSQDFFDRAEPLFSRFPELDAYGVIFLDTVNNRMTPLVKVVATNTLVWEGSCGSGSLAAAVSQSISSDDGVFEREYIQPAGIVRATVERANGDITATYIGGPVTLSKPMEVEL